MQEVKGGKYVSESKKNFSTVMKECFRQYERSETTRRIYLHVTKEWNKEAID
ncbi:hypothetical protein QRE67_04025 [Bacillus sp. DX3.1]|nr:hypothetical protein QRE67_04025 [Bacillus sp. DX3.1]